MDGWKGLHQIRAEQVRDRMIQDEAMPDYMDSISIDNPDAGHPEMRQIINVKKILTLAELSLLQNTAPLKPKAGSAH